MPMIDADTHVDESEATWKKLEGTPFAKYIPVTVTMPPDEAKRAGYNPTNSRCWVVEGRLQNRAIRDEVNHPPRVLRELEDVPGRLAHMDKMGVGVQVIFPTFFIRYNTMNAEAEWALTTTYNRWLAAKCAATNGRLRWAAVLPLLQPHKAVEELRWAKEHGACGIFKRGFDLNRPVTDPYFFPIYEESSALNVPLCIHTGHPLPGSEWDRGFPIMYSFTALVTSRLPQRFRSCGLGSLSQGPHGFPIQSHSWERSNGKRCEVNRFGCRACLN
jgi:predicted TIM-barrel fold metal-dependent hydrolase